MPSRWNSFIKRLIPMMAGHIVAQIMLLCMGIVTWPSCIGSTIIVGLVAFFWSSSDWATDVKRYWRD